MLGLLEFFWTTPAEQDSASAAAALALTFADPRGWGSKHKKGDDYHPLPDSYWEDRAKILQVDKRDPTKVFEEPPMPEVPKEIDMEVVNQMLQIQNFRNRLTTNLTALPDLEHVKVAASRINELDDMLVSLNRSKYKEIP